MKVHKICSHFEDPLAPKTIWKTTLERSSSGWQDNVCQLTTKFQLDENERNVIRNTNHSQKYKVTHAWPLIHRSWQPNKDLRELLRQHYQGDRATEEQLQVVVRAGLEPIHSTTLPPKRLGTSEENEGKGAYNSQNLIRKTWNHGQETTVKNNYTHYSLNLRKYPRTKFKMKVKTAVKLWKRLETMIKNQEKWLSW